jgi:hypothetical protein
MYRMLLKTCLIKFKNDKYNFLKAKDYIRNMIIQHKNNNIEHLCTELNKSIKNNLCQLTRKNNNSDTFVLQVADNMLLNNDTIKRKRNTQ